MVGQSARALRRLLVSGSLLVAESRGRGHPLFDCGELFTRSFHRRFDPSEAILQLCPIWKVLFSKECLDRLQVAFAFGNPCLDGVEFVGKRRRQVVMHPEHQVQHL